MERARWSSRRIFLLAAIGSAVGLGNVWRFPYLTYKFGGGAFLVPYLAALFLLGIPLLILEFALGQKLQKGAVGAFTAVHYKFRGIGLCAIFSGFVVVVYYAAVMAWSLVFLLSSFTTTLPWKEDAKGFFFNDVLQITDGIGTMGGINWMLFFALFAVWVMIYFSVWKGVKSVGQIVKITMPLPILLLLILFLRGITLEGAMTGIARYLMPDFSALLNGEIWLAAASQIFFTLSLGFGIMIAYASYNEADQDITGDALITSLSNSAISLFAGFVVFSILGYMAVKTGVGVEEVVASGPGLAFVVFPQALSLMPGAWFFAILFFVTLLSLGIDSAFSLVEAVNTVFADKVKKPMLKQISFCVCSVCFLLGILFTTRAGLYWLDVIDHFITSFGLVLVGIFECLVIGWVYGADQLREYINSVSHRKLGPWWCHAIKWFIPGVLSLLVAVQFVTELKGNYEGYPAWAIGIGWLTVILPMVIAVVLAFKSKETEV
ncbi:MAG: sodium-dependent transporter [Nitrospiria bacterium]